MANATQNRKVLFFIAGISPTTAEQALIDRIVGQVHVRSVLSETTYGASPEACDVVAKGSGVTIPMAYNAKTDVTPLPVGEEAALIDGSTASVKDAAGNSVGTGSVQVTDSAAEVTLPGTVAAVANAANVTLKNSAGTSVGPATASVSAGVLEASLPSTKAVVANAAAVTVKNSAGATISASGVATVASGVLSSVALPATVGAVANGQALSGLSISGVGTTVTFTVANGVITGITLS